MTKHTPGPWLAKRDKNDIVPCVVTNSGDGICEIYNFNPSNPGIAIANARLIAAAPDLLKALKLVSRWILEQPMNQAARDLRTEHRNQAIAAIAKAEGRGA